MGRAFGEMCDFTGCLPSELYQKHDPTIGDFVFVVVRNNIKQEDMDEMLGGGQSSSTSGMGGGSMVMPHVSTKGGK